MSLPSSADEPRAFYDEMWRRYAHLDAKSPAGFHRRRLVRRLAARAPTAPRAILDVGCGQGALLADLAAAFPDARLAGSDVSEKSLERARMRRPGVDLFAMDLLEPGFEERHASRLGRFELVVCSEVVEHLTDDRLAMRRLAALVAPGGRLIVTVPGGKMSAFDVAIGHVRHYRRRPLAELVRSAGLEVLEVVAWGFPFHSLYRSAVRVASRVALPSNGAGAAAESSGWLGSAYEVFGRALMPLFYLNADRFGEQLVAVAEKP